MKSKAGFILALIGGIFTILGSLSLIVFAILYFVGTSFVADLVESTGGSSNVSNTPIYLMIVGFFWMLVVGILSIIAGARMNKDNDQEVKKGGVTALILGILSINILTLLGGILGIMASGKGSTGQSLVKIESSFQPTLPR
jgi:Na+-driven multidrug efflux pump